MKGLALTATFLALMAAIATAKPVPIGKMSPSEDLNPTPTRNDAAAPLARCLSGSISRRRRPSQPAAYPAGCIRPSSTKCNWPNCVASALIGSMRSELK